MKKEIYKAIKNSIKSKEKIINLHEPDIGKEEYNFVEKSINSTFVSSFGKFNNQFEKKIREITKSKYVCVTNSGTSSLHLSLLALNINLQSEIFVPAISFIASANSIKYVNAIPHFLDIELENLGIDPIKLENRIKKIAKKKNGKLINKITGREISAIMPVHTFGHPCKIDKIIKIAKKYNLKIIEDAAEGLGSYYNKKHVGTFGDLGVISFNGNKIITTGGGGVVITNNKKLYEKVKHLSSTAKVFHKYEFIHDQVGFNYRMNNLNSSFGVGQIIKIRKFINNKRNLFKKYNENFRKIEGCKIFKEPKGAKSNYWLQTLFVKNLKSLNERNKIIEYLISKNINVRPVWKLTSKLKPYKNCPADNLENAKEMERTAISLPSSSFL